MKVNNIKEHPELERVAHARKELRIARSRLKETVVSARKKGYSLREISDVAGVSDVTILNWSKNDDSSESI